jgi:hypothetical protein
MKYGLIVFKHTDNIGDDILSYAASRFLPQIDYCIDREEMDLFYPQDKEYVKTIMNGWYLYNKFSWPPSPYLFPLVIGMHMTSKDYLGIGYDYISGQGKEFFEKFQPIGCRDTSTKNMLSEKNIDSYFSGCLTLTLQKFPDISQENKVIIVDVSEEIENKIKNSCDYECIKITHTLENDKRNKDWDIRKSEVEKLLKQYQSAKCVVTSRLHVALPCLALGTPVHLIYDDKEADRFSDYLSLLHYSTESDFLEESFSFHPDSMQPNKDDYKEIRKSIENKCYDFVNKTEDQLESDVLPDVEIFIKQWVEKAKFQKHLLSDKRNKMEDELVAEKSWNTEQKKAIQWLEVQSKNQEKIIEEKIMNLDKMQEWVDDRNRGIEFLGTELEYAKKRNEDQEILIQKLNNNLASIKRNIIMRIFIKLLNIKLDK